MRQSLCIAAVAALLVCLSSCAKQEAPAPTLDNRPSVEASASVDKAIATTGDVITYRVTVNHKPSVTLDLPEVGSEIAGLRIIDFGRDKNPEIDSRVEVTAWYQLRGDLVGSYILPSITIAFQDGTGDDLQKGTIETSEIFLEIKSVLPKDGSATDIRGLKKIRRVDSPAPWALYGGIAAVVLALLLFFIWQKRKNRPSIIVPPAPAHEIAFEALSHLRQTDFSNQEAIRKYYFSLSAVVRNYVENRFGMNATDLTTEELVPLIQHELPIESPLKNQLRSFLESTDAIKYAGGDAQESEIERAYEQALTFVEATVPQPEPTGEAAA
jgi:hypothetical protein